MSRALTPLALLALLAGGCLGPLVDDEAGYSASLLPSGTRVPSIEREEPKALAIDGNDGIDGETIPLHTAFADGQQVRYWDLGATQGSLEPLWRFRRKQGGQTLRLDHPDLVDSIPGDGSYSALRVVYDVFVTEAYDGERITSLRALDDAIELGLVKEPKAVGSWLTCVVVLAATRMELGSGEMLAPEPVYYRGTRAHQICLDDAIGSAALLPVPERGPVAAPNLYALQRKHDEVPLDESAFGVDLDENGGLLDTSFVFAVGAGDARYTSLWSEVSVTVGSDYAWGQARAESDLFFTRDWGLEGMPEHVLGHAPTEQLWNRPIEGAIP